MCVRVSLTPGEGVGGVPHNGPCYLVYGDRGISCELNHLLYYTNESQHVAHCCSTTKTILCF